MHSKNIGEVLKHKILISVIFIIISVLVLFCDLAVYYAKADSYEPVYRRSSFYTAFGTALNVDVLQNADSHQDYNGATVYSSAVKIGEGSFAYNCFTYALIYCGNIKYANSMNKADRFCIVDSFSYSSVDRFVNNNPCITHVKFAEAQEGDIVLYDEVEGYNLCYLHAGILAQKSANIDDCVIDSKWGQYAVYRHKLTDCPYTGSSYIARIINPDPPANRVIEFKFYRINHTYNNIYPVYKNGLRQSVNDEYDDEIEDDIDILSSQSAFHKIECSGCGAFYYDTHNYIVDGTRIVCADCGLVSDTEVI